MFEGKVLRIMQHIKAIFGNKRHSKEQHTLPPHQGNGRRLTKMVSSMLPPALMPYVPRSEHRSLTSEVHSTYFFDKDANKNDNGGTKSMPDLVEEDGEMHSNSTKANKDTNNDNSHRPLCHELNNDAIPVIINADCSQNSLLPSSKQSLHATELIVAIERTNRNLVPAASRGEQSNQSLSIQSKAMDRGARKVDTKQEENNSTLEVPGMSLECVATMTQSTVMKRPQQSCDTICSTSAEEDLTVNDVLEPESSQNKDEKDNRLGNPSTTTDENENHEYSRPLNPLDRHHHSVKRMLDIALGDTVLDFQDVLENLDVAKLTRIAFRTKREIERKTLGARKTSKAPICHPHPRCGSFNLVLILEFEDGDKWVARMPGYGVDPDDMEIRRFESDCMTSNFLRNEKGLKTPEVFLWNTDPQEIGSMYCLSQFSTGSSLLSCWGDETFSESHRLTSIRDIAQEMAKLYTSQSNLTGMLCFNSNSKRPFVVDEIQIYEDGTHAWGDAEMVPSLSSTSEWVRSRIAMSRDAARRHSDGELQRSPFHDIVLMFKSMPDFLRASPITLSLADADLQNILVDPSTGRVINLIDMDNTRFAPAIVGAAAYPPFLLRDLNPSGYAEDIMKQSLLYHHDDFPRYRQHYLKCFAASLPAESVYDPRFTEYSLHVKLLSDALEYGQETRESHVTEITYAAYVAELGSGRNYLQSLDYLRERQQKSSIAPIRQRHEAILKSRVWDRQALDVPRLDRENCWSFERRPFVQVVQKTCARPFVGDTLARLGTSNLKGQALPTPQAYIPRPPLPPRQTPISFADYGVFMCKPVVAQPPEKPILPCSEPIPRIHETKNAISGLFCPGAPGNYTREQFALMRDSCGVLARADPKMEKEAWHHPIRDQQGAPGDSKLTLAPTAPLSELDIETANMFFQVGSHIFSGRQPVLNSYQKQLLARYL